MFRIQLLTFNVHSFPKATIHGPVLLHMKTQSSLLTGMSPFRFPLTFLLHLDTAAFSSIGRTNIVTKTVKLAFLPRAVVMPSLGKSSLKILPPAVLRNFHTRILIGARNLLLEMPTLARENFTLIIKNGKHTSSSCINFRSRRISTKHCHNILPLF